MNVIFEKQRSVRQKRRQAFQRGTAAILDIGTSNISCLILRFDPSVKNAASDIVHVVAQHNSFRVIGAKTTRSRGIRRGDIINTVEVENAIRTVVQGAQKMAGLAVDHVFVTISGGDPRSYGLCGEVPVLGQEVDGQDVSNAIAAIDLPFLGEGREALHAMPVNFAVDTRSPIADPRGQRGEVLSVDLHLLSVEMRLVQTVVSCLKRCELECVGIANAAYASALSVLVEDEKELGAVTIDIGGGVTNMAVFYAKHMIHAETSPYSGGLITSDISKGLQIPFDEAEKLKALHGGVMATGLDDRDMIELASETGDWNHDRRTISRADLIGIIRPRVDELLEDLRARLENIGFFDLPSQRIVLTGGGSELLGLDGLAGRVLGQQVRIGRPMRVQGLPSSASGCAFAAVVGMILYATHPQDEFWDFDLPIGSYGPKGFKKAVRWFKENW